ncbi:hypothetical protein VTP01DRAFT_875 [Rhizomucor pusillus]|uniref:uncharacterized protein n=1 Tax=Rhizomucor pusillus TaxID=4840 RepID=UPI003742A19F
MQSLLYNLEERLEDAGGDQARLAMMARIEATMGHDEEVSLKDRQPPSKLKSKGRPRGTGRLSAANELLDKHIREQQKLDRKRERLNSQNDSQTGLQKNQKKHQKNRHPFKKLRVVVNPPSPSTLPAFKFEAACQHDLRKFMGNPRMPGGTFGFSVCRDLQAAESIILHFFGLPDDYRTVRSSLQWYDGPYGAEHCMPMPLFGYVLANAYKQPIHCFSALDSYSFLPDNAPAAQFSSILLLMRHSAHYVNIRLAMGAPIPQITMSWKRHATKDSLA